MKTTKGGKVMNPTDAYRKELRKKELKRNKKERKKVREVGILKKDPDTIKEQIDKLEIMRTMQVRGYSGREPAVSVVYHEMMSIYKGLVLGVKNEPTRIWVATDTMLMYVQMADFDGYLFSVDLVPCPGSSYGGYLSTMQKFDTEKAYRVMLVAVASIEADGALDKARKHKKRQLEDTLNLVMKKRKEYEEKVREKGEAPVMFSHLGPPRRRTAAEEEDRAMHPQPEDSVYFHPTLNPTGAPPPGKPPMYKSSFGPRIPSSTTPSSDEASSSKSESEEVALSGLLPPPPPPLPDSGDLGSRDGSALPSSLPLPPPSPMPPKKATTSLSTTLLPPPSPPGPPPKEQAPIHTQPPPPGTGENMNETVQNATSDNTKVEESDKALSMLPPPPPPLPQPGLLAKSESDTSNSTGSVNISKIILPPPPPPPALRPALNPSLQADVPPPGISRFPPPPPPPPPGPPMLPGPPPRPVMVVASLLRPPFGPLPGPPPPMIMMMRPPLPPGPPAFQEDDHAAVRFSAPQKPSYVKSAASTVVKRPLAQHTPELTAMIPASVRVRRETVTQKAKPKSALSLSARHPQPASVPAFIGRSEPVGPKSHSVDDSYTAFLEDMKALGALDS
ncbi:hypothetical protein GIB67_020364 [Kingdonia uniflora]|uniref:Wbp11/ELF5/Saf1 N-terminal domain-containing protein n=1 Tax=Kingdonia uniflora TaxID=39325 RepID=A0A7J7LRA0_9MAGN|nr:hypothetical protein GIB67_020364 [Kingdonia uniflora]